MPYRFMGAITFDLRMRLLGTSLKRQLRVSYEYTPPWPFIDPESGAEITGREKLTLDLDILARPRAEGSRGLRGAELEPYWTSAKELLAMGVLNWRVYGQLDELIDAEARSRDLERRQQAGAVTPSPPETL